MAAETSEPELLTRVEFPLYSVSVLRYDLVEIFHTRPSHPNPMEEGTEHRYLERKECEVS